jgi:hypothetical protein
MGHWGVGPFESDDGGDFAYELDRCPSDHKAQFIHDELRRLIDEYTEIRLDNDNDSRLGRAYAAAAVLAAQKSRQIVNSRVGVKSWPVFCPSSRRPAATFRRRPALCRA